MLNFDWLTALLLADRVRVTIKGKLPMLKLIIGLLAALPTLERDVEGVVNEIKDAPDGPSMIRNTINALRKLADDLEKAL